MGTYFNPSNESFVECTNDSLYVDKTGLLKLLNTRICTPSKCIALSHARRFGKTQAASMLEAYYSVGCNSKDLFSRFEIAKDSDFEKHLNKYNVIHLDISSYYDRFTDNIIEKIWNSIYRELQAAIPDIIDDDGTYSSVFMDAYKKTGIRFIIIIDEWDCIIRNLSEYPDIVHRYMQFLHSIFKCKEAGNFLALGYITGILPIKKIKDESALNNFREYTMLYSGIFTKYYGFTEDEVVRLCDKHGMDFTSMKAWYDGYLISGIDMYNPDSVVRALEEKQVASYWKDTSSYETINDYIDKDIYDIKQDILNILDKKTAEVNISGFKNDLSQINTKDDALTALIHLGYLSYLPHTEASGLVRLPNLEVGQAYRQAIKNGKWKEIAKAIARSEATLNATINMDTKKVAEYLEQAHDKYSSILTYNNENSLACAIHMAYFTADVYYTIVRELPAGKGFADFAFIPRREAGTRPAMIVELKWDQSADTAIRQIKNRRYAGALAGCSRDILLVGINYDDESPNKQHSCIIETFRGN